MLSTVSAPVTSRSDPSQVRLLSVVVPPLESVTSTRSAVRPVSCRFLMLVTPVPSGVMLMSPFVFVDDIVLPSKPRLSTCKSPVTLTPPVTSMSVPSQVKLASSSSEPDVPATTILLSVRSLTDIVEATTSPVPFGVKLTSPFVSVDVIALPLMLMLSTSRSPVTSMPPVTVRFVPLNVRFALSVSEPLAPANVTRVAVKSLTVALASVASPVTPIVPPTVTLLLNAPVVAPVNAPLASEAVPSVSVPPVTVPLAVTLTAPVNEPLASEAVPSVTVAPSTVPEAVTPPVTSSSVPLNVKLPLSSIAPLVPASTTRPSVRSLTVALARVDSPVTPSVPPTVTLLPNAPVVAPVSAPLVNEAVPSVSVPPVSVPLNVPLTALVIEPLAIEAVPSVIVPPVTVPLAVTLTAPVNEPLANEAVPSVTVAPSTVPEAVTPPVTSSSEPLNVRLPLSSMAPLVPANITRPLVRSLTVRVEATTSPVPFGVRAMLPFVSVDVIALPSIVMLSILIDSRFIVDACIPAYEAIVISPAVVPSSVVLIAAKISALSSHINATFVDVPRSITKPLSALGVPDSPLLRTNNGSAIKVFVVSTVVVVPLTVKLPLTTKSLPYVKLSSNFDAVIVLSTNLTPVIVASVIWSLVILVNAMINFPF